MNVKYLFCKFGINLIYSLRLTSADLRSLALSLWTCRARLKVRMTRKRMATARAPTTSSSQLAGRKEVMEEDEELDAVPFAES